MASSDYPYDDIDDFFSSPVKICSIKIDKKDIDEVPLRAIDYYARQMNDWDWPMSLDLKAKEDKLYFTLTGKAQSIEEIESYLCDCASYGFIVNTVSDWLEKIVINSSSNHLNKYYRLYRCEEDLLKENDLKKDELVREQQRFLSDKRHEYYLLEKDYEYMSEFMIASKKKNIAKSDISLLREELGFSVTEGTVQSNTFKKIFAKREEKDLELEF